MKKSVLLVFLLVLISCGDSKTTTPATDDPRNFFQLSENTGYSLNELVAESNDLLEMIAKRLLLKSAADVDKENLTASIKKVTKSLNDLSKDINITSSIQIIANAVIVYENALILKRDKQVLEGYFSKIMYLTVMYSQKYNITIPEFRGSALIDHAFQRDSLGLFSTAELTLTSPKWKPGAGGGNSYAIIQANETESESWLLSPKYDLRGKIPREFVINHISNNLVDYNKIKLMVSTNYSGGNPKKATWDEYSLSDGKAAPADTWYKIKTPSINFEKYADKQIVIGFKFTSKTKDDFTWEVVGFGVNGIGQKAPEYTYDNDFSLLNKVKDYPLDDLSKFKQELFEGDTPVRFKFSRSNNLLYASGYKQEHSGSVILFSEDINLKGVSTPYVQVDNSFRYYSPYLQKREFLKIVILESSDESDRTKYHNLNFKGSEFIKIPSKFIDKTVKLGFIYTHEWLGGNKFNAPNWEISQINIYESE